MVNIDVCMHDCVICMKASPVPEVGRRDSQKITNQQTLEVKELSMCRPTGHGLSAVLRMHPLMVNLI